MNTEYTYSEQTTQEDTAQPSIEPTRRRISLSMLLRAAGVITVIAGMCSYLLEGWDSWNDLGRYYAMVAGTVILALAGTAMSAVLRENKGARAFLGLTLVSILANFTTLGGFIYTAVGELSPTSTSALASAWEIGGELSILALGGVTLLLLLPIAWFAFKIMNRAHSKQLSALFAATATLLLIPLRDPFSAGILIVLAVLIPMVYLHRTARCNLHFQTPEGRFAALSLFGPAAIITARLLWLYEADLMLGWILSALIFAISRYTALALDKQSIWQGLNNGVSVVSAWCIAMSSAELLDAYLPSEFLLPLLASIFAAGLSLISHQHATGNRQFHHAGLWLLVLVVVLNSWSFDVLAAQLVCGFIGVALLVLGKLWGQQSLLLQAAIMLIAGLFPALFDLATLIDWGNWLSLGLLGAAAIIGGSVIERRAANKEEN